VIRFTLLLTCFLLFTLIDKANDTFSIVAVDPATGEVGGAGASCLDDTQFPGSGGVFIISDVVPGIGVVHTQSFYIPANQQNAHTRLLAGDDPDEIIDWLEFNDVENNAAVRQYGIAKLNAQGNLTAAFTGNNCMDYKSHIIGSYYAIQGNILLGQEILDSMEARFLRTDGELAEKLMAALQGGNVPGADSRCAGEGVSSLSSFVRVARPGDDEDSLYLDLRVPSTPFGVEPIDSLQNLFDSWRADTVVNIDTTVNDIRDINAHSINVIPNPAGEYVYIEHSAFKHSNYSFVLYSVAGTQVIQSKLKKEVTKIDISLLPSSQYFFKITDRGHHVKSGILIIQ